MTSLIEGNRGHLEEVEAIELAIAERIKRNPDVYVGSMSSSSGSLIGNKKKRSHKETLLQQHEIKVFADQYRKITANIVETMSNVDATSSELDLLSDPGFEFKQFNTMLDQIKSFHDTHSTSSVNEIKKVYSLFSADSVYPHETTRGDRKRRRNVLSSFAASLDLDTIFSNDESYGKFFNLVSFHEEYLNLLSLDNPDSEKVSYQQYLDIFDRVPGPIAKKTDSYVTYIEELSKYLTNFLINTTPLSSPEKTIRKIESDFASIWNQQQEKLLDNGIFCKACDKLFAKETVYKAHLDGKKHKKNAAKTDTIATPVSSSSERNRKIAYYEYNIKELGQFMNGIRKATRANVQRIAALTERERVAERLRIEDDEGYSESEEETEVRESTPQNSSNLPVGLDGKPMPSWYYKSRGFNIEFECEICKNSKYRGLVAFERHFSEPEHVSGLKSIGIEPNADFNNITTIEGAEKLWRLLQTRKRAKDDELENAVELEDDSGEIMTQKDYNDLKAQGLL